MPPERATGVDLAAVAAAFGRAVHDAGIPCSPERSVRFARALRLAPPISRSRLYWTARAVFVSTHAQVDAFDRVFARVFDGLEDPAGRRGDQAAPPLEGAARGDRAPQPGSVPPDAARPDAVPRS